MNLYLITFQSSLNRIESVYDCHKDLFVEIEKFFTLHLVPYTEAASIPADAYRMAFIASGGVEKMVTQHFELLPYPIHLLTDGQQNSLAASLEIATWIRSKGMKVHIIHGTIPNMVKQLIDHHKAFAAQREVRGKRIGVVGYSSPWREYWYPNDGSEDWDSYLIRNQLIPIPRMEMSSNDQISLSDQNPGY